MLNAYVTITVVLSMLLGQHFGTESSKGHREARYGESQLACLRFVFKSRLVCWIVPACHLFVCLT